MTQINYRYFGNNETPSYASQMPFLVGSGARPISVAEAVEGYLDYSTRNFFGSYAHTGMELLFRGEASLMIIFLK